MRHLWAIALGDLGSPGVYLGYEPCALALEWLMEFACNAPFEEAK